MNARSLSPTFKFSKTNYPSKGNRWSTSDISENQKREWYEWYSMTVPILLKDDEVFHLPTQNVDSTFGISTSSSAEVLHHPWPTVHYHEPIMETIHQWPVDRGPLRSQNEHRMAGSNFLVFRCFLAGVTMHRSSCYWLTEGDTWSFVLNGGRWLPMIGFVCNHSVFTHLWVWYTSSLYPCYPKSNKGKFKSWLPYLPSMIRVRHCDLPLFPSDNLRIDHLAIPTSKVSLHSIQSQHNTIGNKNGSFGKLLNYNGPLWWTQFSRQTGPSTIQHKVRTHLQKNPSSPFF